MTTATLEILEVEDLCECTLCSAEFDGLATDGDLCPACQAQEEAREAAQSELDEAQDDLDTLADELAEIRDRMADAKARLRAAKKAAAKFD